MSDCDPVPFYAFPPGGEEPEPPQPGDLIRFDDGGGFVRHLIVTSSAPDGDGGTTLQVIADPTES